jgi:Uma2 family endonuclease
MSVDEYLEFERAAESRNEYYDGQIYPASSGSFPHSVLVTGVAGSIGNALKKEPGRVTAIKPLVRASQSGPYMYPDVVVTCDEPRFADDRRDILLNPTAIVEVLSKSTEAHDRGRKFAHYRRIESLQEYILVSQSETRVETFLRQSHGEWLLTEYVGAGASCVLKSIDCTIPLTEIYKKVPLEGE